MSVQTIDMRVSYPKWASWAGRVLSGLVIVFMLLDAVMHLMKPPPVVDALVKLGYPLALSLTMAVAALVSTILYAIPRTAILGAILLTAYLGGATASQLRIGASYWFSIVFGILVWAALYLREESVRALIPMRKPTNTQTIKDSNS